MCFFWLLNAVFCIPEFFCAAEVSKVSEVDLGGSGPGRARPGAARSANRVFFKKETIMADPVTVGVIITGLVSAYKAYAEYKAAVGKA